MIVILKIYQFYFVSSFACLQWFNLEYKLSALTWSKRHNFKHCKITLKQAFLKIVHGYVKINRYNIDKAFYILMKLCNNFFTKITNITWCNRNNINVAFMCYRALIWMPLWVVILNFDVFCVSMTAQNNMARMPIRECKCELYFKIFIFSVFQRQPRTIWWECLYENAMWIVISNFDFFLYSNDSPEQYGKRTFMGCTHLWSERNPQF